MKCPHCGKLFEEDLDPESPQALLFHIKKRVHENELLKKRREKAKGEGYRGEDACIEKSLKKWRAWEKWVANKLKEREEAI